MFTHTQVSMNLSRKKNNFAFPILCSCRRCFGENFKKFVSIFLKIYSKFFLFNYFDHHKDKALRIFKIKYYFICLK